MTDKLYLENAYIQKFSAAVTETRQAANGWEIILDRTAFYPESGGQPFDTGEIDGVPVTAVWEENATVIHLMRQPPAAKTVVGRIDWARRFDHMQQHSGQHILSAVFDDQLQAATAGFHLGKDSTQIDLAIADLTAEQAAAAEAAANAAICANLPVAAKWVKAEELGQYPLRKPPAKHFSQLRLVSAGTIDCCPCGGTHVKATGEIGLIKILGWERKNNTTRVEFLCGQRAIADYRAKHHLVQKMIGLLSVPAAELAETVCQRIAKQELLAKELAAARAELSQMKAAALLEGAELHNGIRLVACCLRDSQPNDAAQLARNLTGSVPAVAFIAAIGSESGKVHLVFASNTDKLDAGKLLKAALVKLNGKGGGNPRLAQGGVNTSDKLSEVLAATVAEAKNIVNS